MRRNYLNTGGRSIRLPPGPRSPSALSRRRAITPARTATPAFRADAHAADHCPGTSRSTTCPGRSGECSRRQLFVWIENLHAKLHIPSVEFGQVLINEQGIYRFHRLLPLTLNCLKHAQLDLTMVAHVRSN